MNCYPVPNIIAKVTKRALRPIRRIAKHHSHYVWGGITIVCVGTGVKVWQIIPPTLATPLPTPTAYVAIPEPATLAVLGFGFLLIALVKRKPK